MTLTLVLLRLATRQQDSNSKILKKFKQHLLNAGSSVFLQKITEYNKVNKCRKKIFGIRSKLEQSLSGVSPP